MNKENKNGFTLVELLGVIVVLSILALITIPIISNVVNDMRIKSLESSAYGLIEAGNLYYIGNDVYDTIRFDKNSTTDTLKELSYKGTVKNGTLILDKKGKITVCITDGKNSAYKNYNESKVTTVKGKICNIKENSYIVYLNDEATIEAYDTTQLTELVNELTISNEELKEEISSLKSTVNSNNSSLNSQISEINNSIQTKTTLNEVYPIGSIYITATEDTVAKVQTKFGGTWVAYGTGKTLVGVDTSQTEFNTVEKTGGEKTHTLTVAEMPSHNHKIINDTYLNDSVVERDYFQIWNGGNSYTGSDLNGYKVATGYGNGTMLYRIHINSTGGSQPHNNLQPYITVYMYKRTA